MDYSINFAKFDLQRKDIHELRNLARSIGVAQPTSKKKDVLVRDIISIITGKEEPEYKNANRGRPAKNADYFYPQGVLQLNMQAASRASAYAEQVQHTGVVVLNSSGAKIKKLRFVDSADDVQVDDLLVKKYKLKDNDIVNYELVNKQVCITKINDQNVKKVSSCARVQGKKLVYGATNLLKVDALEQKQKIVEELQGKKLVLPESNIETYASQNTTVLPVPQIDDKSILSSFVSAISMASFYQKSGENTVLILTNYLNLISSIKNAQVQELGLQIKEYLQRFVVAGGTFVAFVPTIVESSDELEIENID